MNIQNESPPNGWILYDGSCGFCSWWVPYWGKLLTTHGYGSATLQEEWVGKELNMNVEALLNDVRLLKPDGTLISGADVYRNVMIQVWWMWPIWAFSVLPLTRSLFNFGYKTFNRNRYGISKACGLKPVK